MGREVEESGKAISQCCRSDPFEGYKEGEKCGGKTLDCSAILRKLSKLMSVLETKSECSQVSKNWTSLPDSTPSIISMEQPVGDAASGKPGDAFRSTLLRLWVNDALQSAS